MRTFLSAAAFATLLAWALNLQRQLGAARLRGDMYRDISTRLDQQLAALNNKGR